MRLMIGRATFPSENNSNVLHVDAPRGPPKVGKTTRTTPARQDGDINDQGEIKRNTLSSNVDDLASIYTSLQH